MNNKFNKIIFEKVIRFSKNNNLIENYDKLLLAISGGPDSIALLNILLSLKNLFKIELSVFHLNHSIRAKESDTDEQFVKRICEDKGITFYSEVVDILKLSQKQKKGVEETARDIRYNYLNKYLQISKSNKIVTGHNANDNLETILFNLTRGTGLKGLAGIPVIINNIIRPILCLTKEEILTYLKNNKLSFRIDSSNVDLKYDRNLIRAKVVPVLSLINPKVIENSTTFSKLIRDYEVTFNEVSKELGLLFQNKSQILILDIARNIDYFNSIIGFLLIKKVDVLFNRSLVSKDSSGIIGLIKKKKGTRFYLANGLVAIREEKSIKIKIVVPESKSLKKYLKNEEKIETDDFSFSIKIIERECVVLNSNAFYEIIDKEKTKNRLILRNWKNGDKIKPFGMKNYKLVSDIITDNKISNEIRKKIMVLCDGDEIVWVCGLRLSENYKVNNRTKIFQEIKIEYKFELKEQ